MSLHGPEIPADRPVTASTDDAAIAEAADRGDHEGALDLLVSAHAAALGRTCMALLGSASEAEAVLRDTLQSALAEPASLRGSGTLRARLSGLARRRCAQRLELGGRPEPLTTGDASPTPAQRARARLAALKPTEREALVLRFEAELSLREVAAACGTDEPTAHQRISRGLSRLTHWMNEEQS
jgi:RNA polymerase sigma-70 factor (ECF subfamily)